MLFNKLLLKIHNLLFKMSNVLLEANKEQDINNIRDELFWTNGIGKEFPFMRDFLVALDTMLLPFGFFMCAVLTVYAVALGINMAKDEDPKNAKKKVISVVTSVIAIFVIVMLLKFVVIPNMHNIFAFIAETF